VRVRLVVAATLAVLLAAPASASAAQRCLTTSVQVAAGSSVLLRLDCRVRTRAGTRVLARGRRAGVRRTLTARPASGRLSGFDARRGTVRYRPRAGFSGRDAVGFRVRLASGRRLRGRIVIRVLRPGAVQPAPGPPADPPAAPPDDGFPPAPPSVAFSQRNWQPSAQDSCPRSLHERFSVIGPDGKLYPGWHPPVVTDPATGQPCTFGHEHGRDPAGSDLYEWVAEHFAAAGRERLSGIPFGLATEALEDWAAANPGVPRRQEDHVGYKVEYENDVPLTTAEGALGVTCDYLVRVHQGSHSPDALSNNVHELLYASRCSDGTELISNIVSRFGPAGEYTRGCDPAVTVPATDNGYPDGPGERLIPDRACMETAFLVPAGRTTSVWAAYERWSSDNALRLPGAAGAVLASYDAAFGVFDPSRYGDPARPAAVARTLDLCWEVEASGDRANGLVCDEATADGAIPAPYAFDDERSPYDGTHRDTYLRDTRLANAGGARRWWTDPYGGNASTAPFPGAICQLVAAVDTPARPRVQQRVFGRNRSHDAPGVHAPN